MQTTNVTEHRIVDTAYQIFRQRGIRSSSLYDVAMACGTKVRNIHQLFLSKKELVLAVVKSVLEKNSVYLQVNPVLSPTAVMELSNFFQYMEKLMTALRPEMLYEIKKYHPRAWEEFLDFKNQCLIPYLRKNMARGVAEGCYRSDFDQQIYAPMYFQLLRTIIYDDKLDYAAVEKTTRQLHNIFFHGILSVKGMRMENGMPLTVE